MIANERLQRVLSRVRHGLSDRNVHFPRAGENAQRRSCHQTSSDAFLAVAGGSRFLVLQRVIVNQLATIRVVPLQLPNPFDARPLRLARMLMKDPGDRRTLTDLCKAAGASKRTMERLFQADSGMTFAKWRQQLRLMQAMQQLAEGAQVMRAALESGYSTPSAFISMFKKALGTRPTLYFKTEE